MLREVATPGSLLRWLARSHPSSWGCAQPSGCVNTVLQSFPLHTEPCSSTSSEAKALQVPQQAVKTRIALRWNG